MTVKELIAKLNEYQPDDVVVLEVWAYPPMKEVRLSLINTKQNLDLNS